MKKAGKRLYQLNLKTEYPLLQTHVYTKTITGRRPLLQKDYGKALDCAVTSLAFLFGAEKYPEIEAIATKYFYNGDKWGTNPFFIRSIMNACLKEFKMEGKGKSLYGKGIGWNFKKVKALVDQNKYLILNLHTDGRGYYKDHSVTIIGVVEYSNGRFLSIYDNWNYGISYIDYDKLSLISSINWYE